LQPGKSAAKASGHGLLEIFIPEFRRTSLAKERISFFKIKKSASWCTKVENFYVPNKIQPQENSRGGGKEVLVHISSPT
jgi:hypothetical protein